MQCSKCGQEVPADAIYCPYCTGDRRTTDGEVICGGIKAIAFTVPIGTFTTGLIIGLVKAKREWK